MKYRLLLTGALVTLGLGGWIAWWSISTTRAPVGSAMQREIPATPRLASVDLAAPVEVVLGLARPDGSPAITGPTSADSVGAEFSPGSVGALLVQFYGEEWVAVRGELAQRIDLHMQPDMPIPPWESVLEDLRKRMRVQDSTLKAWKLRYAPPEPITLEYLAERYADVGLKLDGRDITALEALLIEPRAEVHDLLGRLRSSCDALLARKFELGQYNYGLFSNIRSDRLPKRSFYTDGTGIRGWSVTWGIAEDEDPDIAALLARLFAGKNLIRQQIHEYLAALK